MYTNMHYAHVHAHVDHLQLHCELIRRLITLFGKFLCTFLCLDYCWIGDFNHGTNSNKEGGANLLFIVAVEVKICFLRPWQCNAASGFSRAIDTTHVDRNSASNVCTCATAVSAPNAAPLAG